MLRSALALVALTASSAAFAAPVLLPLHGNIATQDGELLDGDLQVTFRLYAGETGGDVLYGSARSVRFTSGNFTTYLGGDGEPLDSALFLEHPDLVLTVELPGDGESDPIALGAVAYAAYADHAGDADTLAGQSPEDFTEGLLDGEGFLASVTEVCFDTEEELHAVLDDDYRYTTGQGLTLTGLELSVVEQDLRDLLDDDYVYTGGSGIDVTANVVSTSTTLLRALLDSAYADIDDVYTKTAADAAFALKTSVYTQSEIDTALAAYAKAADVYTKTEVDDDFPTFDDVYTQAQADEAFAKADEVDVEIFVRGSGLTATGSDTDGMALDGSELVLTGGGYGDGTTDLTVNSSNSPYLLPPGEHHFRNITIASGGVLTTTDWNGRDGGTLVLKATGEVEIAGEIDLEGKGFRGGLGRNLTTTQQWIPLVWTGTAGESWSGERFSRMWDPVDANGGGGGGGGVDTCSYGVGGGGGGYGTAGSTAGSLTSTCNYGLRVLRGGTEQTAGQFVPTTSPAPNGGKGGATYGDAPLTTLWMGSGGGGSGSDSDCIARHGGDGGDGGGAIAIYADEITVSGTIDVSGDNGTNASRPSDNCSYSGNNGGGGGGSGGSVKLVGTDVTVASGGQIDVRGGSGGSALGSSTAGGAGGSGRVRIEYNSYTNSGTIQSASTSVVSAAKTTGAGEDGTYGTWTSPLIDGKDSDARFKQFDVFARRGPGTHIYVEACVGDDAADADKDENCVPVAPSGAVDAAVGDIYAKLRVTVHDASPGRDFALTGIRAVVGY